MITELRLINFKCFARQTIELKPLTVLAGLNGMGKSTVIQSLLVLRQSFLEGHLKQGLLCNAGNIIDLGTLRDAHFEFAKTSLLGIAIKSDDLPINKRGFKFSVPKLDQEIENRFPNNNKTTLRTYQESSSIANLLGIAKQESQPLSFQYLKAERNGPRKFLPKSNSISENLDLGSSGEYVFHFLDYFQDRIQLSENDPRLVEASSLRLRDQLSGWLDDISPGASLSITPVTDADLMLGGYAFSEPGKVSTRNYRSTNVGFGLSYVLPVIVSLLSAKAGSLLIIENPEAHLHPKGQTKLGELCARAAAAGVQIIIETHSDHFMDGARIAVHDALLSHEDVCFNYFRKKDYKTIVSTPKIDSSGRLSEWPEGFFDQHRRNAAKLMKPRTV
ncbi:DUF3696 domain-containing protein [Pseudomonas frederiksbergensis]|uniref:DUF3696 domain-containing protein n=1 Tax=Pseudomonas frederiksbergensis TaxID=104087 RepID=UPI003D247A98